MIEHARPVPPAPPSAMTPAISPLTNFSSRILAPPSAITAAASWRVRSSSVCQDAPAAAATREPATSAPAMSCAFKDKSTIHGLAPARASTSATNRASLPLEFIVANTATIGSDALKKTSRVESPGLSAFQERAAVKARRLDEEDQQHDCKGRHLLQRRIDEGAQRDDLSDQEARYESSLDAPQTADDDDHES